ncbi:GNAT family N-acetyltransferase [Bacillus subtilis]|uniref:GNAT family N-acetyltransferase n=1 Tax=Pseudochrobactrum asaccharolyticum TaxID=354351 RepID=UPI001F026B9B|nr:GNAT family N-acetyltransferase [Pseudochrobactrum asaccharolyticum]MCF7646255.1 GNAT family N-acetyltransferase [Pseudochrobactrum asaccharolyticum]MCF7673002.1 GNAT family N-acetyltransferase [Bacillus subtilis]
MSENTTPLSADWRLMQPSDLAEVYDMSCVVHPDFPEDAAIYKDRLEVFAAGSFVLQGDKQLLGYSFSHPWMRFSAPALNTLLQKAPEAADSFYMHDVALLPQARAFGAARKLVSILVATAQAHGFDSLSLVAVNGSQPYWEKQGFSVQDVPQLREKLLSYSEDARFMMRNLVK